MDRKLRVIQTILSRQLKPIEVQRRHSITRLQYTYFLELIKDEAKFDRMMESFTGGAAGTGHARNAAGEQCLQRRRVVDSIDE